MKVQLKKEDIELLNENETFELEDGTWEFASQFCGVHVYKTEQELMEWLMSCRESKKYKEWEAELKLQEQSEKEIILKELIIENDNNFIISKQKIKEIKEKGYERNGILYLIGQVIFK